MTEQAFLEKFLMAIPSKSLTNIIAAREKALAMQAKGSVTVETDIKLFGEKVWIAMDFDFSSETVTCRGCGQAKKRHQFGPRTCDNCGTNL